MRVIFTPLAERNINSLHEYIAEHTSEERADGYVGRIVDFCNGLSTFPLRGTQRDDLLVSPNRIWLLPAGQIVI